MADPLDLFESGPSPEGGGDPMDLLAGDRPGAAPLPLGDAPPIPEAGMMFGPGYAGQVPGTAEQAAGAGTIAEASLPAMFKDQIRIYARARGIPEERYRVHRGQIIYQDDRGIWNPEIPTERTPAAFGKRLAAQAGPAIPITAGMGAGIATAPMLLAGPAGAVGSIAATAGAQGAGEAARQTLSALLSGAQPSAQRVLEEGALGAVGQGAGGVMSRYLAPRAAPELLRYDRPAATQLGRQAQALGTHLTPAEATNLPVLKGQQRALSQVPQSADIMDDFYRQRGATNYRAAQRFLRGISEQKSPETAGEVFRAASKGAVTAATKVRADQARPIYQKAFREAGDVDSSGPLEAIENELVTAKGKIGRALNTAKRLLTTRGKDAEGNAIDIPDTNLEALHGAKVELDDMIEVSKRAGQNNQVRVLMNVKEKLLGAMDEASPDYQSARAIYSDLSPGVGRVKEGIVGRISDMSDIQIGKVGQRLFSQGPNAIRAAKQQIMKTDPSGNSWNGILRTVLESELDAAGREFYSTSARMGSSLAAQGPKWAAKIYGDLGTRANLRAAMTPEQFSSFRSLMKVLQATGRALDFGSDTAFKQEALREMKRQSGGVVRNLIAPQQIPGRIREWVADRAFETKAEKLAEIITSPGAMKKLRALKQISPTSARAIVTAAHALGIMGAPTTDIREPIGP